MECHFNHVDQAVEPIKVVEGLKISALEEAVEFNGLLYKQGLSSKEPQNRKNPCRHDSKVGSGATYMKRKGPGRYLSMPKH